MNETKTNGAGASVRPDFPSVQLPADLGNVQFTISTQRSRKDRYCKETVITLQGLVDELSAPEVKPETHAQYLAMNKDDQTNSRMWAAMCWAR